uniref:Uncharacterized protein n=1 Tax=Ixodes ricinus TaxID=34613 RepID=A0A6B0U4V7_IXORI
MRMLEPVAVNRRCASWRCIWKQNCGEKSRALQGCPSLSLNRAQHNPSFGSALEVPSLFVFRSNPIGDSSEINAV